MIRQALPIDFDDIVQIKKQLALDITRLGDTAYKKEIVQRFM